jgi:hypothetical protein
MNQPKNSRALSNQPRDCEDCDDSGSRGPVTLTHPSPRVPRFRALGARAFATRIFRHPSRFPQVQRIRRFDPVASPAILAGSTVHFHVYFASVLGQSGDRIAQSVLKNCERDYQAISKFFAQQQSLQFSVLVAPLSSQMDGTGGAYHHSCLATDLYCDVQISPTINADVTSALAVAEMVEVFEAMQGGLWNCGASNGEGLSRVLAEESYPGVLEQLGYSSAKAWLNSRRPNWVGRTLPTDQSMVANGCAVTFLNYLHTQLGFDWDKICQAAAPTLALTYNQLTGKTAPFRDFASLVAKKFPEGIPTDLGTDNPFPIDGQSGATHAAEKGNPKK